MTSYQTVYDAFLSKMSEDEWVGWSDEEIAEDFLQLLKTAISLFSFPRKSIYERNSDGFIADLDEEEIQILSSYMKCAWLERTILSWENTKPAYDERDWSQANLISKFSQLLENTFKRTAKAESKYYRSIKGKPFDYSKLAGTKQ